MQPQLGLTTWKGSLGLRVDDGRRGLEKVKMQSVEGLKVRLEFWYNYQVKRRVR